MAAVETPGVTWEQVTTDEVHVYTPDGTWVMYWPETVGWGVFNPAAEYRGSWADRSDALAFIVDQYAPTREEE